MTEYHAPAPPSPRTGLPTLVPVRVEAGDGTRHRADAVIVYAFADEPHLAGDALALDAALSGALQDLVDGGDLKGKPGEVHVAYGRGAIDARRVLVAGLGRRDALDLERCRTAAAAAANRAAELGCRTLATTLPADAAGQGRAGVAQALVEGVLLATYRFEGWRSRQRVPSGEDAADDPRLTSLTVLAPAGARLAAAREGAAAAEAVGRGTALARDLVNLPANVADPAFLARTATEMAARTGLRVAVHDRAWMEREGMGAILAVAKGSRTEPKFIELEHNADRTDLPLVALVGKGVTFDTGGLSLKTRDGMVPMKGDMAGAAAVLGAMRAVAELDLPIRALGVCACVENMPDGNAFRPSDVLVAGSGLSIEVLSTDAEGRLALADALWYVQRFEPDAVIDIATLTGASAVALGAGVAASLFANDDALRERVEAASAATSEPVWHMPLFEDYRRAIRSDIADLKNTGGQRGGVGTAAVFLEAFTAYPWAHIDMATMQTAQAKSGRAYAMRGATGYGVRLFVALLRAWGQGEGERTTDGESLAADA